MYGHKYMDHKYMGHQYTGSKYFGLEVKEQVGRVGSCDVGNYLPICPLATSSVKIKRRSTFILRPQPVSTVWSPRNYNEVLSNCKVEWFGHPIFPRES